MHPARREREIESESEREREREREVIILPSRSYGLAESREEWRTGHACAVPMRRSLAKEEERGRERKREEERGREKREEGRTWACAAVSLADLAARIMRSRIVSRIESRIPLLLAGLPGPLLLRTGTGGVASPLAPPPPLSLPLPLLPVPGRLGPSHDPGPDPDPDL
jgi:hypothetical protein